jgi:hypothetical protein
LNGARLQGANLQLCRLNKANLRGANLYGAELQRAMLNQADLRDANLADANLDRASLKEADLRGAQLKGTHLASAQLRMSLADEVTLFEGVKFDDRTNFTGVALDTVRMPYEDRVRLEYNLRKPQWIQWCAERPVRGAAARLFWSISDYGRSTERILCCFLGLALMFAVIYLLPHLLGLETAFVSNLATFQDPSGGDSPLPVPTMIVRAACFSLVTMTTLGFGEVHAAADSIPGHLLVATQGILGYILMGALITRMAIMFQSRGVA